MARGKKRFAKPQFQRKFTTVIPIEDAQKLIEILTIPDFNLSNPIVYGERTSPDFIESHKKICQTLEKAVVFLTEFDDHIKYDIGFSKNEKIFACRCKRNEWDKLIETIKSNFMIVKYPDESLCNFHSAPDKQALVIPKATISKYKENEKSRKPFNQIEDDFMFALKTNLNAMIVIFRSALLKRYQYLKSKVTNMPKMIQHL